MTLDKFLPVYDDNRIDYEFMNVPGGSRDLVRNENMLMSGNFSRPRNMHCLYKDLLVQFVNVDIVSMSVNGDENNFINISEDINRGSVKRNGIV